MLCLFFWAFVVQWGAVISTQPGLQWTINMVPGVVTKRFNWRFTEHGELLYWIITVLIPQSPLKYREWQKHKTSASTNPLVTKTTLCCFVCFGEIKIFSFKSTGRMMSCFELPALHSRFSMSSPCSAPAELKLWILSAFQTVPLSAHSALSPWH